MEKIGSMGRGIGRGLKLAVMAIVLIAAALCGIRTHRERRAQK